MMTKKTGASKGGVEELEILTVDQTARLLQVSRATVYKLINEGEIPCRRIGERWRFSKKAVMEWVAKD